MDARQLAAAIIAAALAACQHPAQPLGSGSSFVTPAAPPPATEWSGAEWGVVNVADIGDVLIAVTRPSGEGPFPAVIILHGTHGFAQEYVRLAADLSQAGFVAVAACWFVGGGGAGANVIAPIGCPEDAPAMPAAASAQTIRTIEALRRAVSALPGVQPDRIALFGHSRGGGAVLNYLAGGGDAAAAVVNSAGYPDEMIASAGEFSTPLLILHGEADSPADGGSVFTDAARARAFEAALLRAGTPVEAVYYDGAEHNALFANPLQYEDEVERMAAFLDSNVRN
jgi:dienelactone hydrolase